MKKEIELAKRAVELAMLISIETTTDAWFDYSGHVNTIMAHYAPNGYDRTVVYGNSVYILISEAANIKNLQYTVDCFEFIYAVAERKSNA